MGNLQTQNSRSGFRRKTKVDARRKKVAQQIVQERRRNKFLRVLRCLECFCDRVWQFLFSSNRPFPKQMESVRRLPRNATTMWLLLSLMCIVAELTASKSKREPCMSRRANTGFNPADEHKCKLDTRDGYWNEHNDMQKFEDRQRNLRGSQFQCLADMTRCSNQELEKIHQNYIEVYEAKKDVAREAVLQNAHYVKAPGGLPKDKNAMKVAFLCRHCRCMPLED